MDLKRTFEQTDNAPQRVPSEVVLHESPHLSPMILAQLTIEDLGSYACTSKGSRQSARPLFLLKAIELGYNPSDSFQAIKKLKKLFKHVRTLRECGKVSPLGTTEKIAYGFSRMSLSLILDHLSNGKMYSNLHHPLLELLESERSWQHAGKANRDLQPLANTALAYAAYYKRPLLVQRLLEMGTDLNRRIHTQHPRGSACHLPRPLQTSILVDDMPSVQQLIAHGAVVNIQDLGGFTRIGGAYFEIPGMSVLQYALGSQHVKTFYPRACLNIPMIKFLLEQGADITNDDLVDAAETCSIETLQRLMHPFKRLHPDTATDAFSRVVEVYRDECAIDTPAHQMLEFLLNQGADVNGRLHNYPLHRACASGSLELVKYLVSKGADLSLVDANVMTPLSTAVQGGRMKVVQLLLESKADVNQLLTRDEDEPIRTALTYLCCQSNADKDLVMLLLSYGADPQPEGCDEGESPMECAKKNELTEIVKMFEDHLASKAEGAS